MLRLFYEGFVYAESAKFKNIFKKIFLINFYLIIFFLKIEKVRNILIK